MFLETLATQVSSIMGKDFDKWIQFFKKEQKEESLISYLTMLDTLSNVILELEFRTYSIA